MRKPMYEVTPEGWDKLRQTVEEIEREYPDLAKRIRDAISSVKDTEEFRRFLGHDDNTECDDFIIFSVRTPIRFEELMALVTDKILEKCDDTIDSVIVDVDEEGRIVFKLRVEKIDQSKPRLADAERKKLDAFDRIRRIVEEVSDW